MISTFQDSIVSFFSNLFDNTTKAPDYLYAFQIVCLSLVILSSLVLALLMIKYRGKRPLDLALLFREVTFILVIVRTFLVLFLGWSNPFATTACFFALLLACVLTLFFIIQEHRQGRRVINS